MNANKNNQFQNDALESVAGGGNPVRDKLLEEAKIALEFGTEMMRTANEQFKAGKITRKEMDLYFDHLSEISAKIESTLAEAAKYQN